MSITQTLVKELFDYRDGSLYWKVNKSTRARKGKKAGCIKQRGYLETVINSKAYKNHRIIFLIFHGYSPIIVDHIDGNKLNNNIENLRAATSSQNLQNAKLSKSNTSGVKGVVWEKDRKYWKAQIVVNGKTIRIGKLESLELAQLVAQELRNKYHGEYANNG